MTYSTTPVVKCILPKASIVNDTFISPLVRNLTADWSKLLKFPRLPYIVRTENEVVASRKFETYDDCELCSCLGTDVYVREYIQLGFHWDPTNITLKILSE